MSYPLKKDFLENLLEYYLKNNIILYEHYNIKRTL